MCAANIWENSQTFDNSNLLLNAEINGGTDYIIMVNLRLQILLQSRVKLLLPSLFVFKIYKTRASFAGC